jgi:hypothetical protein
MRKQLVIMGVCLLFITLCFSGCEEIGMKPDYINVVCVIQANAYLLDKNNNMLDERPVGLLIDVEITKAGGENCNSQQTVNSYGLMGIAKCTFKLYKEQDIEAVLRVQGGYNDFYPVAAVHFKTLTWAEVESVGFGETYSWIPMFQIGLKNETTP